MTKNAVVCSDHFEKDNFWPSVTGPDDGSGFMVIKRRLKPYSVPTIFSFRSEPKHRPSPADRLALAEERQKQQLLRKSLPVYGPPTLVEHLFQQLAESERRSQEHELQIEELKKENQLLRSQLFRFENVSKDHAQLEYLTGLSKHTWNVVWKFLRVSPEKLVSQEAASRRQRGLKI